MKIAGLFAGIGGLEAGLDDAGHRTVFLCEIDEAAREVLKKRFSYVKTVARDIRDVKKLPSGVDLVAAGFPCQDLSQAGMTQGMNGAQSVLIDEVFRLLKKDIPHVLLENVSFMLHLHKGQALRYVIGRLEDLGYAWAYRVVDTRSFGLPQRRERVFIFASKVVEPWRMLFNDDNPQIEEKDHRGKVCGFYWTEGNRGVGFVVDGIPPLKGGSTIGIPSSPAMWFPNGKIMTPDIRDAERLQGFQPDWTKPAEKVERPSYRWKLVGNAVTVDVAEWLGRVIVAEPSWKPFNPLPLLKTERWPNAAYGSSRLGRFKADVSNFPLKVKRKDLGKFLEFEPKPLSLKATEGFVKRLRASSLRYPPAFLQALEKHCLPMQNK